MAKKYEFHEVYSPPFIITFPNLVKPDTFSDKPQFNFRALFGKDKSVDWFNNAVAECARKNGMINAQNQYTIAKFPDQPADGDLAVTKDVPPVVYEGHPGHNWLKFRSSDNDGQPSPIGIIDTWENVLEASTVYSGSWYRAIVRFCIFDNQFGVGVMTRCDHLQFLGHAEPFTQSGGTKSTVKAFSKALPVEGLPANVAVAPATTAPQAAAPGNTQAPPQTAAAPTPIPTPTMAPGEYASEFIGDSKTNSAPGTVTAPSPPKTAAPPPPTPTPTGPTMGPNADPMLTYAKYIESGWTDDVMRANGIII